jgi:hypothetical protein
VTLRPVPSVASGYGVVKRWSISAVERAGVLRDGLA